MTAGHYLPIVIESIKRARKSGLTIPIVYNSSGYEKVEAIEALDGIVDIFLPDFKYISSEMAARYSNAPDYPEVAKRALAQMVKQTGGAKFDERDMMKRGVIVRHLILPGHIKESKEAIRYLYETYGDQVYISIMNQYTPMPGIEKRFKNLGRTITQKEYDEVVDYAIDLGVENGFIQEAPPVRENVRREHHNPVSSNCGIKLSFAVFWAAFCFDSSIYLVLSLALLALNSSK